MRLGRCPNNLPNIVVTDEIRASIVAYDIVDGSEVYRRPAYPMAYLAAEIRVMIETMNSILLPLLGDVTVVAEALAGSIMQALEPLDRCANVSLPDPIPNVPWAR